MLVIDDLIPFRTATSSLLFYASRAADLGMWVPFLEKAWAKLNGNYDRIISGNEMEGFYLLTGFPS